MLKNFLMRKMLKSQLKGVPDAEQEKIISALEKNPKFFEEVALEVQAKIKEGKDQVTAVTEVMQKRGDEFKKIMQ